MRVVLPILSACLAWPALAEWGGRIQLQGDGFFKTPPSPVAAGQGQVEAEIDGGFRASKTFSLKFHPVVRATTAHEAWEKDVIFDPKEVYLEAAGKGSFLRLGFFTPKWEGTDGLNPMDIASVRDWSDPLGARTLATGGVQVGMSWSAAEFEAFYSPQQTRSLLLGERSPWLPRRLALPVHDPNLELRLPDNVEYRFLPREETGRALSDNAGLRVQAHGEWGDFALAGFEGAADWPLLQPIVNVAPIAVSPREIYLLQSPVELIAIDYRRRSIAGLLQVPVGEWIFRFSGRHDQPIGEDFMVAGRLFRLPGWTQQFVAGFERSFEIGGDSVTFLLQGAWGERADDQGLLSISDVFDRAVLYGVRWPVGEEWVILLSGLQKPKDGSHFEQLEISRRWSGHFSTDLFAQSLGGPETTLPGLLSDRDRAGVRLTASF